MKKLLALFTAAVFFTAFCAQAQTEKKTETKTPPAKTAETKTQHSDYAMMDGKMMHCMGAKQEPMTKDVTLKNGTTVSMNGEVKTKDGKTTMLKNGWCVDMHGKVGPMDEMHNTKKEAHEKM